MFQPHFFEREVYRALRIPALPGDDQIKTFLRSGVLEPGSPVWFRKGSRVYSFVVEPQGEGLILRGVSNLDRPASSQQQNGISLDDLILFIRDMSAGNSGGSPLEIIYKGLDPVSRSVSLFDGLIVARFRDGVDPGIDDPEELAISDFFLRWMKRTSLESFLEISGDKGTAVMTAFRQMAAEHPECTADELLRHLRWEAERESDERRVWIRMAITTGVAPPAGSGFRPASSVMSLHVPSDSVALLTRLVNHFPAHTRVTFPVPPRILQTKRFLNLLLKETTPTGFFRFEGRHETWITLETGTTTGPARAQARIRFVQILDSPVRFVGTPHADWAREARRLKEIDSIVRSIRLKDGFFEGPQFRVTVIPFRHLEKNGIAGFIVSPLLAGGAKFLENLRDRLPALEVLRKYRGSERTYLSLGTVRPDDPEDPGPRICFVVTESEAIRQADQPLLWFAMTGPAPPHFRVYPVRWEHAFALAGLMNHPVYCPLVFEQIRLMAEPFSPLTAGRLLVPAPHSLSAPLLERVVEAQKKIQSAWLSGGTASPNFPQVEVSGFPSENHSYTRWGYAGDPASFAPLVRVLWLGSVREHSQWFKGVLRDAKILRLTRRGPVALHTGLSGVILETSSGRQHLEPETAAPLVLWAIQRGLRTILIPDSTRCGAMMRFLSSLWETATLFLPPESARIQFARFYRNHILRSDILTAQP